MGLWKVVGMSERVSTGCLDNLECMIGISICWIWIYSKNIIIYIYATIERIKLYLPVVPFQQVVHAPRTNAPNLQAELWPPMLNSPKGCFVGYKKNKCRCQNKKMLFHTGKEKHIVSSSRTEALWDTLKNPRVFDMKWLIIWSAGHKRESNKYIYTKRAGVRQLFNAVLKGMLAFELNVPLFQSLKTLTWSSFH